jgi:hypothetical protein
VNEDDLIPRDVLVFVGGAVQCVFDRLAFRARDPQLAVRAEKDRIAGEEMVRVVEVTRD